MLKTHPFFPNMAIHAGTQMGTQKPKLRAWSQKPLEQEHRALSAGFASPIRKRQSSRDKNAGESVVLGRCCVEQEVSAVRHLAAQMSPALLSSPWMTDGTRQRPWPSSLLEPVFSLYVYVCVYVYMYFNSLRSYIYTCVSMCKTYTNRCVWLERTLCFAFTSFSE